MSDVQASLKREREVILLLRETAPSKNENEFLKSNNPHLLSQILVYFLHQVIITCLRRGEEAAECNKRNILKRHQTKFGIRGDLITKMIRKVSREKPYLSLIKGG